ncbi:MAG TPA: ABC transporter ATP-binding protein [Candidatus Polarisedimenticolia bacterium]|nr:ABC transporter ATP-binding protein [Candidatus Polarisedimenticolia bacterium]
MPAMPDDHDASPPRPPVLALRGAGKVYEGADGSPREALRGATLEVAAGDTLAIVGRSGSGKSTLLHLAAGIDAPTSGTVEILGRDLAALSDRERTLVRRDTVGMVFQFFHLIPHLDVLGNVLVPAWIAGERGPAPAARARELVRQVGLAGRESDEVTRLSGGQMQRVAIARALLRRPRLLLADEPTGNLDDETSRTVMDLLLSLAIGERSALVYVTHSLELAALARRVCRLHSGLLEPGPGAA